VGQRAFFTVDSLPEKQFMATVSQVRLEPITNSNVVTYKVVMEVPNEPLPGADHPQGPSETDPEKAWERAKDRLPEGTTKEEFLARFKARMAERAKATAAAAPRSATDRLAAARTPGGAGLVGGPTFSGNLAIRPGMTANVTILTNQRRDVLRVPNAALRFNPAAFVKEEKKPDAGRPGGGQARPAQRPGGSASGMAVRREDHIWILENGKPKAISVKAGISDGQFTEVSGDALKEGMQVLVGVEESKSASNGARPLGGGPFGRH
jgi:HlyD family secretion protein